MSDQLDGERFFTRVDGRRAGDAVVRSAAAGRLRADVVFAVDSIPAILAATRDPFIVFTIKRVRDSRSARALFRHCGTAWSSSVTSSMTLVLILGFVGVKMILALHYQHPQPDLAGDHSGIARDRRAGLDADQAAQPRDRPRRRPRIEASR